MVGNRLCQNASPRCRALSCIGYQYSGTPNRAATSASSGCSICHTWIASNPPASTAATSTGAPPCQLASSNTSTVPSRARIACMKRDEPVTR